MVDPKPHSFSHNTARGNAVQAFGVFNGNVYLGDHGPSTKPGNFLGPRDPRIDLERIRLGNGLISDCLNWIVPPIQRWLNYPDFPVLWIRGDAGKGKTTLIMALVDQLTAAKKHAEVHNQTPGLDLSVTWEAYFVSFFFFRKSDHRLNNVTDALRSLLYLLSDQSTAAKQLIEERCDIESDSVALHLTLQAALAVLEQAIIFLIDAVDECQSEGWHILLQSISNHPATVKSKSKWIITSRKQPNLSIKCDGFIDLEDDRSQIKAAVTLFAQRKSQQLIDEMDYENDVANRVRHVICSKAGSTFLWVALACSRLAKIRKSWEVEDELKKLPIGLTQMYDRMMDDLRLEKGFVRGLLCSVLVAFRPLSLFELESVADLPHKNPRESMLRSMVESCASFLTIRHGNVELIHDTAREYLTSGEGRDRLKFEETSAHAYVTTRTKSHLTARLTYNDICNFRDPGSRRNEVCWPVVMHTLLGLDYSTEFFLYHYTHTHSIFMSRGLDPLLGQRGFSPILTWMSNFFLQWTESFLWYGRLSAQLELLEKLGKIIMEHNADLHHFLKDARQFLHHNRGIIEVWPLQLYSAALIFAPHDDTIRRMFQHYIPSYFKRLPDIPDDNWDEALVRKIFTRARDISDAQMQSRCFDITPDQVIAYLDAVKVIRFERISGRSPYSTRGILRRRPEVPFLSNVKLLTFSPNGLVLVYIWETCESKSPPLVKAQVEIVGLQSRESPGRWVFQDGIKLEEIIDVRDLAWSHDSRNLAIWFTQPDSTAEHCVGIFEFFHNSPRQLGLCNFNREPYAIAAHSGFGIVLLIGASKHRTFMNDGDPNSDCFGSLVRIDERKTGMIKTFPLGGIFRAAAFFPTPAYLAIAMNEGIGVFDLSGERQYTLSHSLPVEVIIEAGAKKPVLRFSRDENDKIDVWEVAGLAGRCADNNSDRAQVSKSIRALTTSPDGSLLAWSDTDNQIKIEQKDSGDILQTLTRDNGVSALSISSDNTRLAIVYGDKFGNSVDQDLEVFNLSDSTTLIESGATVAANHYGLTFSPDNTRLATLINPHIVVMIDISSDRAVIIGRFDRSQHAPWTPSVIYGPSGAACATLSERGVLKPVAHTGSWAMRKRDQKQTLCIETDRLDNLPQTSLGPRYPAYLTINTGWIQLGRMRLIRLPSEWSPSLITTSQSHPPKAHFTAVIQGDTLTWGTRARGIATLSLDLRHASLGRMRQIHEQACENFDYQASMRITENSHLPEIDASTGVKWQAAQEFMNKYRDYLEQTEPDAEAVDQSQSQQTTQSKLDIDPPKEGSDSDVMPASFLSQEEIKDFVPDLKDFPCRYLAHYLEQQHLRGNLSERLRRLATEMSLKSLVKATRELMEHLEKTGNRPFDPTLAQSDELRQVFKILDECRVAHTLKRFQHLEEWEYDDPPPEFKRLKRLEAGELI